ncbi:hypothetical protein [Natrarchaeobius oligotrophus]|uniref:Uncharacterized protein n=1 Tax=Natrarchaeobius chitinivorans TaxID=1679083 RepID=A0A3N6NLA3_NATCH|nr:hypothetical protein [Natrarchaeobius chitinivorans]RQH00113.1 hypothetical protein EA472_12070 [Natrarchaeobius chitinivorans]
MAPSTAATVSRWSRAFVATGVAFFLAWHLAVLAGYPRPATVALGLYGFVFHVVFGKAYGLVPSYFARELAVPRAPTIHLPLAAVGAVGFFANAAELAPPIVGTVAAASWLAGCLVFVGSVGWTVRSNWTGRETGTGSVDAHRTRVDRIANAAIPFVFAYLLVGSSLAAVDRIGAGSAALPAQATTHLLAAGAAALLVFAIGFRLLPRLLAVAPHGSLVAVVLPTGAVGPALLALGFRSESAFRIGAALQMIALVGFAVAYADVYRRSERRRVGGWTILAASGFAVLLAALGGTVVVAAGSAGVVETHYRIAIGGFLGLTIVGVTYHFYPPAVASSARVDDRTAAAAALALIVGLALEGVGLVALGSAVATAGRSLSVLGAVLYAVVLGSVFRARPV